MIYFHNDDKYAINRIQEAVIDDWKPAMMITNTGITAVGVKRDDYGQQYCCQKVPRFSSAEFL